MAAHVQFPAVDERPASLSKRWIGGVLRGELRFQGAVFTDDLSMGGAASCGNIVERAELALAAGCDVLPVCNDRAAVVSLLNDLDTEPEPASQVRIVRMRGRDGLAWDDLTRSSAWRAARDAVARSAAAPAFTLRPGAA
jgi:beta-N-acetylhexosaminidase